MLMCNENLTLVRHIREDDGDRYECVPVSGGSWYRKKIIAIGTDGARPVNTCQCRIPDGVLPDGVSPRVGDYMVRGTVGAVSRGAADFGSLDYMLISSVGDNRRGRFQHWAVSGV